MCPDAAPTAQTITNNVIIILIIISIIFSLEMKVHRNKIPVLVA
jgi:hypothetical protein